MIRVTWSRPKKSTTRAKPLLHEIRKTHTHRSPSSVTMRRENHVYSSLISSFGDTVKPCWSEPVGTVVRTDMWKIQMIKFIYNIPFMCLFCGIQAPILMVMMNNVGLSRYYRYLLSLHPFILNILKQIMKFWYILDFISQLTSPCKSKLAWHFELTSPTSNSKQRVYCHACIFTIASNKPFIMSPCYEQYKTIVILLFTFVFLSDF